MARMNRTTRRLALTALALGVGCWLLSAFVPTTVALWREQLSAGMDVSVAEATEVPTEEPVALTGPEIDAASLEAEAVVEEAATRPVIRLEPEDGELAGACGEMVASSLIVHNDGEGEADAARDLRIGITVAENAAAVERIEFNADVTDEEGGMTWAIGDLPAGGSATLGFIVFVRHDAEDGGPIKLAFEVTNESNQPERNGGVREEVTVAYSRCGEPEAVDEPPEAGTGEDEAPAEPEAVEEEPADEPTDGAEDAPEETVDEPTDEAEDTPEETVDEPTDEAEYAPEDEAEEQAEDDAEDGGSDEPTGDAEDTPEEEAEEQAEDDAEDDGSDEPSDEAEEEPEEEPETPEDGTE